MRVGTLLNRKARYLVFWVRAGQILTSRASIFWNYNNDIFYPRIRLQTFERFGCFGGLPGVFRTVQ